ncbi:MAG: sulfatase [Bacteroidota bacterium]
MVKKLIILQILLLTFISCKRQQSIKDEQPNIIIIFTDDQGYQDVNCFGSPDIKTPHLDKIAQDGIRLTNFYVAQPVCSASRAALLTGCYPNRVGIHGALFPDHNVGLNISEITIADMLKENGYKTGIFGKWHLGDHPDLLPLNQGFDEYLGTPYSNDMWPVDYYGNQVDTTHRKSFFPQLPLIKNNKKIKEIRTLEDQAQLTTTLTKEAVNFIQKNKENPFFLYFPHPMPHVPLAVSDKFKGKSERGLYGDVIMEIDWSVGQIMKSLKDNGLEENTIVIFISDNGPWLNFGNHAGSALPLREGKGTAFDGGVRVPGIVYYPNKIKPGQTIDIPMMTIDILPTIAEITKSPLPKNVIDGKSVWNIWTGKSTVSPHEAYFFYYHKNELHGVRYNNWKMYFPHRYRTLNGRPGGKNGFPVKYDYNNLSQIELYDLSKDISETTNIAVENPEVVDTIKSLANQMRIELGDALRDQVGKGNRPIGKVEE